MKVLGVDYGRSKIGVAAGDTGSKLADPVRVIKYKTLDEVLRKLIRMIKEENVEKVVIGLSQGQIAEESREFGRKLTTESGVEVVFQDETLTTRDAERFAIDAGIKRSKRRGMEDAYSAALILQTWLDS